MDRYWFLTWTTYGTWLPGDERESVTRVRESGQRRVMCHIAPAAGLKNAAKAALKSPPIYLTAEQAEVLLKQLHETAQFRGWLLLAVAIMRNHVHVVLGVEGDPDPEKLLGDAKSYGSRALNQRWGKPASGTWWTESGSKHRLRTEATVLEKIEYVKEQEYPLLVWIAPGY